MRILIVKQFFNPEPTAKSLDFAKELVKRGHQVEVLAGFPSYPTGKIYPGFKQRLYKREQMEGVNLIRVPIYPDHSASGFKRFLHYLSYALSATFIGLWLVKKPDVCFVYQGAIPVAVPAIVLKKLRGVRFVYDINDLWPETVATSGMLTNSKALKIINAWCNWNYRNAGFITVCTPGFKKKLTAKGVPAEKMQFVSNWSRDRIDDTPLDQQRYEKYFKADAVNLLYAGNLGIVQALDVVLEAAKSFQDQNDQRINFILLGGGADETRLKEKAAGMGLDNLQFIPRVQSEEVSMFLNAADVLLVHLKNDPLFEITIPSKILAYLKSGKPILMGLKGDAKEILEAADAGFAFEPDSTEDFIRVIHAFLDLDGKKRKALGVQGAAYYQKALSLESSVDAIEEKLEMLCRKS